MFVHKGDEFTKIPAKRVAAGGHEENCANTISHSLCMGRQYTGRRNDSIGDDSKVQYIRLYGDPSPRERSHMSSRRSLKMRNLYNVTTRAGVRGERF